MSSGLVLMVVGMGTVFLILTLLVGALTVSATFFASWPEDDVEIPVIQKEDDLAMIAIALAAIERG